MKKLIHFFLLASLTLLTVAAVRPAQPAWQLKVDEQLLASAADEPTEFILFLETQADLSAAALKPTKVEKGRYVYEQLSTLAARTQGPVLAALQDLEKSNPGSVDYRPYWVANMIWVRGDAAVLQHMAQRPEIARVYANPAVKMDLSEASPMPDALLAPPLGITPNLTKVGAPAVWAMGYNGSGAVIGGQDTGYAWEHPALKSKYRGWYGTEANHNYNWHDAIHSGLTSCGVNSPFPCDDGSHGTHTMGIMVGDDGEGNQVGMAPGARWIGCRNMAEGVGTPTTYAECYQWFIAPTDLNNLTPRPELAPDVINNSWSCTPGEGCDNINNPNILLAAVNAVRAAGIVTVHAAGNDGPICTSINKPGGIYDASFTVGSTSINDIIVGSSSRGPVIVDGSGRIKPDITAPGEGIMSSVPPNVYGPMGGTSMAAPHVAGLVALMLSADLDTANANLAGDVDRIEQIIQNSAVQLKTAEICGGVPGTHIPNNTYGYGRINALWATLEVLSGEWLYLPVIQ